MGLMRTTGRMAASCGLALATFGLSTLPAFAGDGGRALSTPVTPLTLGLGLSGGGPVDTGNSWNSGNFRNSGRAINSGNFNAANHTVNSNNTRSGANSANGPQCVNVRNFRKGCVAFR
jgi:hypothetical protein